MSALGRNDSCPCGSGKKYKQCCQRREAPAASGGGTGAIPAPAALQAALEHHRAGRLPQAKALYQQILRAAPDHADALHYLGAIASGEGKHRDAADLIGRAIRIRPSRAMYYNLGNALKALGDLDGAVESYREALALKPDYAEAHVNLGNALQAQGKLDEAAESYRRALALKPDLADAHVNLGNALKALGDLDGAAESYRRALALKPDHAETHYNLGNVFVDQGKPDAAISSYRNALALNPDYADAHVNLGNALHEQGKLDDAVENHRKALLLKPDLTRAHYNLGNALQAQGKLDEAIWHYRRALASSPDLADAHNNLGLALQAQGALDEAAASYREALAIKPDYAKVYSNLLFLYGHHATLDPPEYLSLARNWERACLTAEDRQAARDRVFRHRPPGGRRLKVGYVSGDYRQHPVSCFVEPLFARHDRARIELFAYSNHGQRDAATERLQALADHWVPVSGTPDAAIRERIEADGIDVLVDLSGHTGHNRLGVFALRAAPVQAYYLGYFASTGLTEMDYWIGDETLTPPETDSHFSEQVWRLPRISMCYTSKADAPLPGWCPAPDGAVRVGSFNNLGKLTPATLALWAEVLHALPEAKLLLKTKDLADADNRQRILGAMASHGILPDRIELRDSTTTPDWPSHMAYYNRLDIALDPVGGHGGVTTTCDALWMAVPVVTLMGGRVISRMTSSMLEAIGHPEWVARSEAEYVAKVVALARDVGRRKALRSAQRDRMAGSPLCDASGLARALEDAFDAMFDRWWKEKTGGSAHEQTRP